MQDPCWKRARFGWRTCKRRARFGRRACKVRAVNVQGSRWNRASSMLDFQRLCRGLAAFAAYGGSCAQQTGVSGRNQGLFVEGGPRRQGTLRVDLEDAELTWENARGGELGAGKAVEKGTKSTNNLRFLSETRVRRARVRAGFDRAAWPSLPAADRKGGADPPPASASGHGRRPVCLLPLHEGLEVAVALGVHALERHEVQGGAVDAVA